MELRKKREKPKKLHSDRRNFLYKLKDNLLSYFLIAACVIGVFVTGIVLRCNKGKIKETYIPSENPCTTTVENLDDLEIVFIDVGQGDSVLVKFPDGKNMLVDGGKNYASVEEKLDKYLTVDGKKLKIDYCVATHPDADHIGSLDYVYKNYEVGYSFRPFVKYKTDDSFLTGFNAGVELDCSEVYAEYLAAVKEENCGYEFFTDKSDFVNYVVYNDVTYSYKIDFLMPYATTTDGYKNFKDTNDFSAVVKIEYGGKSVLLCGDINSENIEKSLINSYKTTFDLRCDVLKIAHHGSAESSSPAFMAAVKPTSAILSCGVGNYYGHPANRVVTYLKNHSIDVYRTDLQGSVDCKISADGEIEFSYEFHDNDGYLFFDGSNVAENDYIVNENKKSR